MENNKLAQIKSIVINNKKNLILTFVGLLIVFGLGMALNYRKNSEQASIPEGCKEGYAFSETTGKPCLEIVFEVCAEGDIYDRNTGEPCMDGAENNQANSKKGSMGYESALKEYTGKSLVFDSNCVSNPSELSVSLGSSVLLANNSDTALSFNAFGRVVNLRPYHYMLGTVSAPESVVSCNDKVASKITAK